MFKDGSIYITGSTIYESSGSAATEKNEKALLLRYRGYAFVAQQDDILLDGKVYRLRGNGGSAIGFLNEKNAAAQSFAESGQLSPHFNKSELACECGGKCCNGYNGVLTSELAQTALFLEGLRRHANIRHPGAERKIVIQSGVRCPATNAKVGGALNSLHLAGKAADISINGLSQAQIATMCLEYFKSQGYGGVGHGGGHYTHVDRRQKYETWKY